MADVAEQLELSVGTLYRYVEGKDALFYACVGAASPSASRPDVRPPVTNPPPGTLETLVRDGVAALRSGGPLKAALRNDQPDDVAAELAEIIGDLYDRTAASRRFQTLLEAA